MHEIAFSPVNFQTLMVRFPKAGDDTVVRGWRRRAELAGEAAVAATTAWTALRRDPGLTEKGIADRIQALIERTVVPRLNDLTDGLRLMAEQRERLLKGVALKQPDRADAAAAVVRAEIRAAIRTMSPGQRMQTLIAADVTTLQAIGEVPAFLTALTDQERALVEELRLERALDEHPEIQAQLDIIEKASEVFGVVVSGLQSLIAQAIAPSAEPQVVAAQ